jgi:hypothetical protein
MVRWTYFGVNSTTSDVELSEMMRRSGAVWARSPATDAIRINMKRVRFIERKKPNEM